MGAITIHVWYFAESFRMKRCRNWHNGKSMRDSVNKLVSRRPALQDVARLAGVSPAAVSYVVNGRTSEVGAQTRQKIESAIKELNYRPQRRGLSLRYNREFAIGFVIVDPNPHFLADPFTTQVATGLSNALAAPGYGLTVAGCSSVENVEKLLARPIGVDAFIAIASGPVAMRQRVYELLSAVNLPVVVIQDALPACVDDGCAIMQDDFCGAELLARHLVERGAKRFLFVSPSCVWPAIERRRSGIKSVLPKRCSLSELSCDEHDFAGTTAAIEKALTMRLAPDAIMGANDQIAIAALRALERRGMSAPVEAQVTGFNNFDFRQYVTPLLTTVTSNAADIGRSCAEAILARLDDKVFKQRTINLPVTFEPGGTTRSDTRP